MGDAFEFSARPIEHYNFLLPIELAESEVLQVYIKVDTESSLQVPLVLWDESAFYKQRVRHILGQGLFFGMLLVIAIYNIFVYFSVRYSSYFYYTLAVMGMVALMASLYGFGFQYLWPTKPEVNQWANSASLGVLGYCSSFFLISFLSLKQNSRYLFYLMVFHAVLYVAVFVSAFTWSTQSATKFALLAGLSLCIASLICGLGMLFKGKREARYYLIAYGALLLATVVVNLNKAGLIPRYFITEYIMQISSVIGGVLLSFALADRINSE